MSWGEGPGEVRDDSRAGRKHGLFLEGERAEVGSTSFSDFQEELRKGARQEGWRPQGGVHGVSSGQAFLPNVPQFPPSC